MSCYGNIQINHSFIMSLSSYQRIVANETEGTESASVHVHSFLCAKDLLSVRGSKKCCGSASANGPDRSAVRTSPIQIVWWWYSGYHFWHVCQDVPGALCIRAFVCSYLYQIAHLGDDDDEPEFSSSMPLEEGDTFFFAPRMLKNLVMVDEMDSLSPIMHCQVQFLLFWGSRSRQRF